MRRVILIIIFAAVSIGICFAQPIPGGSLPEVRMVTDNYDYMISLFPEYIASEREALKICSTIVEDAESLAVFWAINGDSVLYSLSVYSGISWVEYDFPIYLVPFYPDYGIQDPLTIPLRGRTDGDRIIALPDGLSHYLTLFRQLAARMLEQARHPGAAPYMLFDHPLMEKTPRRFDNLANLLALKTIGDFFDIDSVLAVFRSANWRDREIGQEVFFDQFWGKWKLSPDSNLAMYLADEPFSSRLVSLTRPPAAPRKSTSRHWGNHQRQAPPGGNLGLSVARDRSGFYRVVRLDTLKLAYLSGLRKDDLIRNVEGRTARNIRTLFTYILEDLEDGVHVDIIRDDEPDAVIIYPWEY